MPAATAFMLLDLKLEEAEETARREQEKFFLDYLSRIFSQPSQHGESPEFKQARDNFVKQIQPQTMKPAPKQYTWSNIPQEVLAAYENGPALLEGEEGGT